jgi:molybdopterin molybdotransferase
MRLEFSKARIMAKSLLNPDAALEKILEAVHSLPVESRPLETSAGFVTSDPVDALCELPSFDNSAMDGFALREEDARGASKQSPAALSISQTIPAGAVPSALALGTAAKIMTGAPMPDGADTVVPKEYAREENGRVEILEEPGSGDHVRRKGDDVRLGARLLAAGRRIRPYEIGLLAGQGIAEIRVHRRPRAAIMSSGDELVPFRDPLGPGRIRNSSGPALAALVESWGFEPVACGIARDREDAVKEAVDRALSDADVLLLCGGVSVGDFDHTRSALDALGFEEIFWRVAIRPGKPLLFGTLRGKPVFGLPGNPISTMVTAEVFARPALEKMGGARKPAEAFPETGVAVAEFEKPRALRHFLFCSLESGEGGAPGLRVIEPQGSAMLAMGAKADALAVGPVGVARIEPGMELRFKRL